MKRTPLRRKGKRGRADDKELARSRPIVWARDAGRCRYCNWRLHLDQAEFHHIGGRRGKRKHHPDNLMVLCHWCHVWVTENPKEAKERGFSR